MDTAMDMAMDTAMDTVVATVTMKLITMDTMIMDMDTDTGIMASISTRRRDTSMITTVGSSELFCLVL